MITLKVKLYSSITGKTLGLIGRSKPEPVMFLTRFGIHTFGMKFPLDIVVLDDDNIVIKLKNSLKPNCVFFWPPKYKNVLELPEGYIENKNIKIGSKLSLKMLE